MPKPTALSSLIEMEKLLLKQHKSLGKEKAESLRELILLEEFSASLPPPERELATAFWISRAPMTETTRAFETEGLIKCTAKRRLRVANLSLEEPAQNLAVIGIPKALGGELARSNARHKDLSHIIAINADMKKTTDKDAPLENFRTDTKFHNPIIAPSGNTQFGETHRQYNTRLCRARFVSSRIRALRDYSLEQHQDILNALTKREEDATSSVTRTNHEIAITT